MNTRGFTLIELTALIVVLVAIFLVSFPSFLNIIRADDKKEYDNMVKDLCLTGRSYIYSHKDDFDGLNTVGTKIDIDIKELIEYYNMDKNIVNVKTKKTIDKDTLTYTVLDDYALDCKYINN